MDWDRYRKPIVIIIPLLILTAVGFFVSKPYLFPGYIVEDPGSQHIDLSKDEGAHDMGLEWWYLNGYVRDSKGGNYAIFFSLFNNGTSRVALIDRENGRYYSDEVQNEEFDSVNISTESVDWNNLGGEKYRLTGQYEETSFNYKLNAQKPPIYWADDGSMQIGSGGKAYYYTLPDVGIDGEISIGGKDLKIKGRGVIDHHWNEKVKEDGINGWKWWSIKLANGYDLFYLKMSSPGKSNLTKSYLVDPRGRVKEAGEFEIRTIKNWKEHDKLWDEAWDFKGTFGDKSVELKGEIDFRDQFLFSVCLEAVGSVEGFIDGENVSGDMFYEQVYYNPGD